MSVRRLPWILAYDVRCKKRLYRVHKWMLRWAAPVQYSVFLGYFREHRLKDLLDEVSETILKPVDDLRAYPVADRDSVIMIGTHRCPENWEGLSRLLKMSPLQYPQLSEAGESWETPLQVTDLKAAKTREQSEPMP